MYGKIAVVELGSRNSVYPGSPISPASLAAEVDPPFTGKSTYDGVPADWKTTRGYPVKEIYATLMQHYCQQIHMVIRLAT